MDASELDEEPSDDARDGILGMDPWIDPWNDPCELMLPTAAGRGGRTWSEKCTECVGGLLFIDEEDVVLVRPSELCLARMLTKFSNDELCAANTL